MKTPLRFAILLVLFAISPARGIQLDSFSDPIPEAEGFAHEVTEYLARAHDVPVLLVRGRVLAVDTSFSDLYAPASFPYTRVKVQADTLLAGDLKASTLTLLSWTAIYKSDSQPHYFNRVSNLPRFLPGDEVLVLCRGHEPTSRLLKDPQFHNTYLPLSVRFLFSEPTEDLLLQAQSGVDIDFQRLSEMPDTPGFDYSSCYIRHWAPAPESWASFIDTFKALSVNAARERRQ